MCTVLCATGTALPCAQNTFDFPTNLQPLSVQATAKTTLPQDEFWPIPTEVNAELVIPDSYEQYLSLTAPTDVSVTSDAVAIADGKSIHVFNRALNVYRTYTHTSSVQKLTLDENGGLYFLSDLYLYKLTLEGLEKGEEATSLGVACKGLFAIYEDLLCYYTSNNTLKFYSLSQGEDIREVALPSSLQSESPLAFGRDGLYCVCENDAFTNDFTVYAINLQTYLPTAVTKVKTKLRSITVANHLLCFVTQEGDFYSYNITDLSASEHADTVAPITCDKSGYVALCSNNAEVYAVHRNRVRHYVYTADSANFTDYEIGASSSSPHRLNGATSMTLNKNRLFIADCNNQRISLYDTKSEVFESAISTDLQVEYLASYQNTLLACSSSEIVLYNLAKRNYGEILLALPQEGVRGKIVGVADVYGRYYVLTEDNYCYTISKETGEWAYTETHKNTQTLRAVAFTADVYGSLFVAYDDDTVYRFSEKQLLDSNERGEMILQNLHAPEKIAVDYEMNFYALRDGALLKYKKQGSTYALNETFTPNYKLANDPSPRIQSYAFGTNDSYTYLLYNGDYIVKTDELQIPIVNPIPVGNALDLIFGGTQANYTVVTVESDAILIEFDVAKLEENADFPYVSFERTQSVQTALKIGEEGEYSILAIAKARTGEYKTCLVATDSCVTLTENTYKTDYPILKAGYVTNTVSLYKFPYLNEDLQLSTLPRGTEVELMGEVIELDYAYYQVQFVNENGDTLVGFIPKNYVTLFNGSTPSPEQVLVGVNEADTDAVWRCAFLVLGFGSIILLVDFLLLRKRNESEEE